MLGVFRRVVAALFLATILLVNAVSHAEVKTYVGKGSYTMSDVETLEIARELAKADAIQNACEKAGVDVKSYLRSKKVAADDDLIETIAKNILKLVEEPHFYPPEKVDNVGNVLIRVTVKAQIDDSDIMRWRDKDYEKIAILVAQTKAMREKNEKHNQQLAELKEELAHNPQNRKKIAQKFEAFGKIFLSEKKGNKAWEFYNNDDYTSAINLHNEAVSLNPNDGDAYYGRGIVYSELGQYELAIQDFDKAIEFNPDFEGYYNYRGVCYNGLGQYERAIQDYDKAIELSPDYAEPYQNRGLTYDYLEQYELAIQDYSKVIELVLDDASTYYNRGHAYRNLGQYELAIQDYNKVIKLKPNYAYAYYHRGIAYLGLENYKKALSDFDTYIKFDPDDYDGWLLRGQCYESLGETSKAQADFAKAKELGYIEGSSAKG